MQNYAIQVIEKEINREQTIVKLVPLEKYDAETNEVIGYLKELAIKRVSELEKALTLLKENL